MILRALYDDAEAISEQVFKQPLPDSMYIYFPLTYVIYLSHKSEKAFLEKLPEREKARGVISRADCIPYLQRSGTKAPPILLVDNSGYILGRKDGSTPPSDSFDQKRKQFRDLVWDCYTVTQEEDILRVYTWLSKFDPQNPNFAEPVPLELESNDLIGFKIHGKELFLHEYPTVKRFWGEASHTRSEDKEAHCKPREMSCLITGQRGLVDTKLPLMIKRVPGGQPSGAAISSFNENAYESYGLDKFSAPITRQAGEIAAKALNALLVSPRHHKTLGDNSNGVAYVYWTSAGAMKHSALSILDEPDAAFVAELVEYASPSELVGKILTAPKFGTPIKNVEDAPFYIFCLSAPSGGRVSVLSAQSLTLRELFDKQRAWFQTLQIIAANGQGYGLPKGIGQLAHAAYRDKKEVPKQLYQSLLDTALSIDPQTGQFTVPPPENLLPTVVRRCQIGSEVPSGKDKRREHVTYTRAMLLKLLLTWDKSEEEQQKMSQLDSESDNKAYRCGRLLYHLECIQYLAVGKVNATLVDRYYGGASTNPKTVFPILIRMAKQGHIGAIRRQRGANIAKIREDELAEILQGIGETFPPPFNTEEQGSFALGYYFQRASVNREIAEAKARKAAGEQLDATDETALAQGELPTDGNDSGDDE
jgi:CRISPR-associated protein Csd1